MNVTVDFQGHDRGFVNPESFTLDATDTMEESDLKGLGAFTFDYDVQWPVSLIISRRSLKRYQILFRFLFQCRLVERVNSFRIIALVYAGILNLIPRAGPDKHVAR